MVAIRVHVAACVAVPPPPLSPPWAVPLLKDSVVAVYMLVCCVYAVLFLLVLLCSGVLIW